MCEITPIPPKFSWTIMFLLGCFAGMILLAATSHCQDLPTAPPQQPPQIVTWDFVLTHSNLAASRAIDSYLSATIIDGKHCVEGNKFFANRDGTPNVKKMVLVDGAIVVGFTTFDYLLKRSAPHSKVVRIITDSFPVALSIRNWKAVSKYGVCNHGIAP